MVTTFLYGMYTIRLLCDDLPAPAIRPSMYIAVGPTAYTIQALITLGSAASSALPANFLGTSSASAADIVKVLGAITGMFLWLLACWFFCLTTVAILHGYAKMSFDLTWWAFIFPNVGFALATIQIGNALESRGISWVASAMTVLLFLGWLFLCVLQIKAIWKERKA